MGARKKSPAALRTIDIFTGKTALEEASTLLAEPEDAKEAARELAPRDMIMEAEEIAVRWLGMEQHHEGDDIKIAEHPAGHAVIVLIDTTKSTNGSAYATRQFRLSRAQYKKLKGLMR